jgi:HSP20 family protein
MADPLRELLALQERVNRLFDNALARSKFGEGPAVLGQWVPAADIVENPEALIVKAELPGIDEKDIDITVTGRTLSVTGECRMGKEQQEGNYHRIERSYGSFRVDFPLPAPIDCEHIQATYRRGILHVALPKLETGDSRQVKVKLNSPHS